MKINVTPVNGLGTYNVTLHYETADKIKKILGWSAFAASVAVITWEYVSNKAANETTDEIE